MIAAIMDQEQGSPDFKKARRRKANLRDAPTDRLPPHDLAAEAAVLGSILLSPDTIGLCIERFPSSEVFFDLRYRTVFETLLSMHSDGVAIDTVTLRSELADLMQLEAVGGTVFLAGLPDSAPSSSNILHYIEIVLDKFTLRKAISVATDVVSRAYEHQGEVDELVEQLTTDILAISQSTQKTTSLQTSKTLVPQSINWAENAFQNQGQLTGIPTGFVDFDIITNGIEGGQMVVVAARPSTGKSSWVMNVADYVAVNLNLPVVVFSLEMSALSLMNRTACARARVPMNLVKRGQMAEVHYARMTSAYSQLKKAPLFIDDESGTSITKFQAKARRYHQQYGIKMIVADYLQLFTAKAESRQHEITIIAQGIKSLAKELNVPILVAAQLNRELEKDKKKRKPRLSDIRESGSTEQEADIVGLLYEIEKEDDDGPESRDVSRVNLIMAKHRNGEAGIEIPLTFFKSFTKFESASTNT